MRRPNSGTSFLIAIAFVTVAIATAAPPLIAIAWLSAVAFAGAFALGMLLLERWLR